METKAKTSRVHHKPKAKLNELIEFAQTLQIEVRTEKLLREVGYHAVSGSCRLGEKKLIILDRDLPVKDQVDLLADEIRRSVPDPTAVPPQLKKLL
ncbi:MAG: hypothetical protein IH796_03330 [Deltaproteobacteria bacterium]|nr:hypothetical protein [Deltaproteobacteria bacterium]